MDLKKTLLITKLAFLGIAVASLSGCRTEVLREKVVEKPVAEGSSSGGGGAGNESGNYLLEKAGGELAGWVRRSSPQIYKNFPKGWTQEKFAAVFEFDNLIVDRKSEAKKRIVNGKETELIFDYDLEKQKLIVPDLFFTTYAHVPVNVHTEHELRDHIREIKFRLLHESAHLLGIGRSGDTDKQARQFAERMRQALNGDYFRCELHLAGSVAQRHYANGWWRAELDNEQCKKNAMWSQGQRKCSSSQLNLYYTWYLHRMTGKATMVSPASAWFQPELAKDFEEMFQQRRLNVYDDHDSHKTAFPSLGYNPVPNQTIINHDDLPLVQFSPEMAIYSAEGISSFSLYPQFDSLYFEQITVDLSSEEQRSNSDLLFYEAGFDFKEMNPESETIVEEGSFKSLRCQSATQAVEITDLRSQ